MNFTIERAELIGMVRHTKGRDNHLRVWACAARVFVESNGVVAGTEAIVVEDGGFTIPRKPFLKLLLAYAEKECIGIEANPSGLRVGSTSLGHLGYTPTVAPPGQFVVFRPTDTWIATAAVAAAGGHPAVGNAPAPAPPSPKPTPPPAAPVPPAPPKAGALPVAPPAPSGKTVIRFRCGQCGQKYEAEKGMEGTKVVCPTCKRELTVPAQDQPAVPPILPGTPIQPPASQSGKLVTVSSDESWVASVAAISYRMKKGLKGLQEAGGKLGRSKEKGARQLLSSPPVDYGPNPSCFVLERIVQRFRTALRGRHHETGECRMNWLQKLILTVGLLLFVASGLVPPWKQVQKDGAGHTYIESGGWGFMFTPPRHRDAYRGWNPEIDYRLLLTEWAIVCVTTGGLMALTYRRRS